MARYAHYKFSTGKESIWILSEDGVTAKCLWLDPRRGEKHEWLRLQRWMVIKPLVVGGVRTDYDENDLPDDLCVKIATRALLKGTNNG